MDNYSENDILNSIDEFLKNVDISLSELEKAGTIFIIFGYSNLFYSADLDILETKGINNTNILPSESTFRGQQFVVLGYILLWIVATKRLQQIEKKNKCKKDKKSVSPYQLVANAYLVSVFANLSRLNAFNEINTIEKSNESMD